MSLRTQLERDEELRLFPYKDRYGNLTIGYGHNLEANGISKIIANDLLDIDIFVARKSLNEVLPWTINLPVVIENVLINMTFNMGIEKLLEFKKTLALIKEGKYEEASVEMLNSLWANEVGDRAKRLSTQLATGREV